MRATCAALILLSSFIGPAKAADFCAILDAWSAETTTVTHPDTRDAASCKVSPLLSGGTQTHCAWVFPYRSAAATEAFDQLNRAVAECLGEAALITQDPDVNHPDFYDLQLYQTGEKEIAVSLKDKAGLLETYVFLRLARPQ